MKYRIRITTFENGRKTYTAQVRVWLGWMYLGYEGEVLPFSYELSSREQALERIDKHFSGDTKKQTIEFEYIYTKNE